MSLKNEWFTNWFDSKYYNILYQNRTDEEAKYFIEQLLLFQGIKKAISVLDVACGNGRHSKVFSKYFKTVVGIDYSKQQIIEAKKYKAQNLYFKQHDMRLPLQYQLFDIVFNAFTSFGYCKTEPENEVFFKNMCDTLNTNGFFIFDYINIAAYENTPQSLQKINIQNVDFEIQKYQDDKFFYKKIKIKDTNQKYVFEEQVRKYSLTNFIDKCVLNDLKIVHQFGNYSLDPFNLAQSPRLILIAQKQ